MCFVIIFERLICFRAINQQSILQLVVNWKVFTIIFAVLLLNFISNLHLHYFGLLIKLGLRSRGQIYTTCNIVSKSDVQDHVFRFLPHNAMLSAVYAVVVCLCVWMPHSGIVSQEALLLQRDRRTRHLSVEIMQLQNISLENPIVWHYLRDSTFSRFDTIPERDRHTHRQTDRHTTTAHTALSIASRGKNRPYFTAHQL